MDIRQRRKLYFLIKDMGVNKVEKALLDYLTVDDFEIQMDNEEALLYVAFNGWYNSSELEDRQTIISSFIQYNLYKGAKSFEKKIKQKEELVTEDFKKQWVQRFGVEIDDRPSEHWYKGDL